MDEGVSSSPVIDIKQCLAYMCLRVLEINLHWSEVTLRAPGGNSSNVMLVQLRINLLMHKVLNNLSKSDGSIMKTDQKMELRQSL